MRASRIAIDAGPLLATGGITNYVEPLVEALLRADPDTDYRLIVRRGWRGSHEGRRLARLAPVARVRLPDRLLGFWWEHLARPLPAAIWPPSDVFLSTCLLAPRLAAGQLVSIVYDCIPLRLPELFPERDELRRTLQRVVERSALIVAISCRTRTDLVDLLGADPGRIEVLYPGCRERFRPVSAAEARRVAVRHGVEGDYLLYVGGLGPHKNVPALLRAYERARVGGGVTAPLVLAGSPRWGAATLDVLERLSVRRHVVLAGRVPDEDLPALYSGARLFVYPSRYEGFGLPVLEAMACGAPVLTTPTGAIPEVGGSAAAYVEPEDEGALAARLSELARDPDRRARMRTAGLAQAARFSWPATARRLATLLAGLARGLHEGPIARAAEAHR